MEELLFATIAIVAVIAFVLGVIQGFWVVAIASVVIAALLLSLMR